MFMNASLVSIHATHDRPWRVLLLHTYISTDHRTSGCDQFRSFVGGFVRRSEPLKYHFHIILRERVMSFGINKFNIVKQPFLENNIIFFPMFLQTNINTNLFKTCCVA